ncbi:MAG: dephospho-CoA kinase [Actinomycetaceae bacterium]|nr:dephospho-CoA kinase [Actinomycetaceae bacterium]
MSSLQVLRPLPPRPRKFAPLVVLTGGSGSGKSSASSRLAECGAVIADADLIARQVLEPGTSGLQRVVEHFGPTILGEDGSMDRKAMAQIVFNDVEALKALEAITHPEVEAAVRALREAQTPSSTVIYDVPLLLERDRRLGLQTDAIVVISAPIETRVARLVHRGMDEADARRRIANQVSDDERRKVAHLWIENDGSKEDLVEVVNDLWNQYLRSDAPGW